MIPGNFRFYREPPSDFMSIDRVTSSLPEGFAEGLNVLVTGAEWGCIGYVVALLWGKHGRANLIIHGRNREEAQSAHSELRKEGVSCVKAIAADFSNRNRGAKLGRDSLKAFGSAVDVVICVHGLSDYYDWQEALWEDTDRIRQINVDSSLSLLSVLIPRMKEDGVKGRICLFSSGQKDIVFPGNQDYGETKVMICRRVQSLAAEHCRDGILTNAVVPGIVMVGRHYLKKADFEAQLAARELLPNLPLHCADVARETVTVCHPSQCGINGAVHMVDGGLSLLGPLSGTDIGN